MKYDPYLLALIVTIVLCTIIWVFKPKQVLPSFKPGVFYHDDLSITEISLQDTCVVWVPLPSGFEGHWVDLGYDFDGRLVAIRVWSDVRYRVGTIPKKVNDKCLLP